MRDARFRLARFEEKPGDIITILQKKFEIVASSPSQLLRAGRC